jgi:hypothetical protein
MPGKVIFVSYSHDSIEHREKVLRLAERLRRDGLDARLDQYVNGTPEQKWPRWMLDQLDDASFVLVVCTETYYRRFRGREVPSRGKGADWEGALITQEIYDGRSRTVKFVPVLLSAGQESFIPEPLRGHTHYELTSEERYQALYEFLVGQFSVEPGPLGAIIPVSKRVTQPLTFDPTPEPSTPAESSLVQRAGVGPGTSYSSRSPKKKRKEESMGKKAKAPEPPRQDPKTPHQGVVEQISLDVEIVCHLPYIEGWVSEGDLAKALVSPNTDVFEEIRIFITARRGFTYLHSNFIKADAEYPTKILTSGEHTLELLLANAIFTSAEEASGKRYHAFVKAMSTSFQYFIDSRIMEPGASHLDFRDLDRISVVSGNGVSATVESLAAWRERRAKADSAISPARAANPWQAGSFYLISFLAVVVSLFLVSRGLSFWMVPVIVTGAILALTVIGALTLRNNGNLSDKSFLELMRMSLASLPILGRLKPVSLPVREGTPFVDPATEPKAKYRVGQRFRFAFGGICRVIEVDTSANAGQGSVTVAFESDSQRRLTFDVGSDFTDVFLQHM